ncbi:MAG: ATP-binding protein [Paraglaciecola sp.]|uniref:ATP-binding protein n=1 Tax=Pseudomonadati TaxID=3379134 RepID=UPI00273FCF12|nr:ATP-binding protein [Paraglaciecola sp.]MDP5032979.1 ATP-binding protein [Paraglaciecola sp.]MDP5040765.1 ATP-binding protein [Paraglaciecola sp.]MDP5133652.1 ATP-binding protein [Paraglaciecola sp.]
MIKKIVFLGGPSTGKTTLCEALAKKLHTLTVAEYGREYWLEHQVDRRLSPEQLLHIAQTQVRWEDEALDKANDVLLCDTNAFTTWHFALHYHGDALPELEQLAQASWQRYDLVVLCGDEIPYDDTWERSGDANRHEFQAFIKAYLIEKHIPHIIVSGSVEQRINAVMTSLCHNQALQQSRG